MYRNRVITTTIRFASKKSNIGTVDNSEISHFKQFSREWWDELGRFRALHSNNKQRIPFIRNTVLNMKGLSHDNRNNPLPLKGITILDVGCGGGLLSEPLAKIGASVTGLDPNSDLIEIAKSHLKHENLDTLEYVCSPIEEHAIYNENKYDLVVTSEVLEHVTQKHEFVEGCVKCVKPGGSFICTTINQTWISAFSWITLGENAWFDVAPKGTHEYSKFIKPSTLQKMVEKHNCKVISIHGLLFNVLRNEWFQSRWTHSNYVMHAVKLPKE